MLGSLAPGGIVQRRAIYARRSSLTIVYIQALRLLQVQPKHLSSAQTCLEGSRQKLTGQAGMNFAHGSSTVLRPQHSTRTRWEPLGLDTYLGPVLANLTYNWMYFSIRLTTPGQTQRRKSIVLKKDGSCWRFPMRLRASPSLEWIRLDM